MNTSTTQPSSQATHEFSLENGLKVIVREDHRAPVVVSQLWYKVGASYEAPGQTGLSHALEHMLFKGSKKVGPGELSRILRHLGAESNAFTNADVTVYFEEMARDYLGVAFELEADRMSCARLPDDEFIREIEVIKEERRLRIDDNAGAVAFERFKAIAYPASGYHTPTIGWMADLERMTIEELRRWYQTWYAPNNAILVVVGDVKLDEVKTLAWRYFGPIPRRDVPEAKKPLELAEPGERQITLHLQTPAPSLMLGFNVPSLATATNKRSVHALRLIRALLDGSYSARIPMQLIHGEKLLRSGSAGYNALSRGDSLFTLSARPDAHNNISVAQAEAGLWRLLDQLKATPPSTEELVRVRAQIASSVIFTGDSIASQASNIGRLESIDLSWRILDRDLAELESVTPAEIQEAARTWFTRQRLCIAHVLPMTEPPHPSAAPGADKRAAIDKPDSERKLQSLAELENKTPRSRKVDVQSWITAEGAKVMFVEARELPMFDLRLTFAAGSSRDADKPGLAMITNYLLNEGVAGKNAQQIAQTFEALGTAFENQTGKDMASASLRCLSFADKREPALKLFAEVVGKPTFPADSIDLYKQGALANFSSNKQSPEELASIELDKRLFGDHPYARPKEGDADNLPLITLAHIQAFHKNAYAAGNVIIVLVGNLTRDEAQTIAAQVSAALPEGPALEKIERCAEPQSVRIHIEYPSTQTDLRLAQIAMDRNDPDYAALSMANKILGGGGFGSRLMREVRERRGLTYHIASQMSPMQAGGTFTIHLKTRAEMTESCLKLVQDVVADYLETGPTEQELDDAKRELTGSFPLSTASNASIADHLGTIGFYDLALSDLDDFVRQSRSLTVEQVKAALNRQLSTAKMLIVSTGPSVPQKPLPPLDTPFAPSIDDGSKVL